MRRLDSDAERALDDVAMGSSARGLKHPRPRGLLGDLRYLLVGNPSHLPC